MPKNVVIIGAVVLVAAAVGGGFYWSTQQPRQFVFAAELDNEARFGYPRAPMRVLINGAEARVAYASDTADPTVRAEGGMAKAYSSDVLPEIKVQYRTPCGWKPAKVEIADPSESDLHAAGYGAPIRLHVTVTEDGWLSFYADNRGQTARAIELGGLVHEIGNDTSSIFSLPQDTRCPEGAQVKIAGQAIGALPQGPAGQSKTTSRFLIDTTGRRCYLYQEAAYQDANALPMMQTAAPPPRIIDIGPAYLNALPDAPLDYFLADLPDKVLVPEYQPLLGSVVKSSLTETPCPDLKKKDAAPRRAPRPSR